MAPDRPLSPARLVALFAPPLLMMGLIFFLSAQPNLSSGLGTWDLILRKLAHMTEFGLLWALWLRALRRPVAALAITLAYAATDEFHQSFVENRHPAARDVVIDACGAAAALLLIWYLRSRALAGPAPRNDI